MLESLVCGAAVNNVCLAQLIYPSKSLKGRMVHYIYFFGIEPDEATHRQKKLLTLLLRALRWGPLSRSWRLLFKGSLMAWPDGWGIEFG